MKVISAIDIGSNAARLLISEVLEFDGETHYKKRSLVRSPLRLGEEVFNSGTIPSDKARQLILTMQAYKNLMEVHGTESFLACATSAMRDAQNGQELVNEIFERTGIKIHIVTGAVEARILYATHFEKHMEPHRAYIYIDVGGGSTEVTIFKQGGLVNTRSFNIGTLRLKNGQVTQEQWREMRSWVEIHAQDSKNIEAIGSGGNINKLYKLNGSRVDKRISYQELKQLYGLIDEHSQAERMIKFGMRSDRADVILPATKIFLKVMKWAKCAEIHVPKFGLSDGILRVVHEELKVFS